MSMIAGVVVDCDVRVVCAVVPVLIITVFVLVFVAVCV